MFLHGIRMPEDKNIYDGMNHYKLTGVPVHIQ